MQENNDRTDNNNEETGHLAAGMKEAADNTAQIVQNVEQLVKSVTLARNRPLRSLGTVLFVLFCPPLVRLHISIVNPGEHASEKRSAVKAVRTHYPHLTQVFPYSSLDECF